MQLLGLLEILSEDWCSLNRYERFSYFAIDSDRAQRVAAPQWKQIDHFTLVFLILSFTESIFKKQYLENYYLGKSVNFWAFGANFCSIMFSTSWRFQILWFVSSCPMCLASLDSLMCEFLKISNLTLRIFDFLRSKSEIISSTFMSYETSFHHSSAS